MKKILKCIIWSITAISIFVGQLYAHPLDISSTFFSVKWNIASVTTFFHSYEIEYLLNSQGKMPKTIKSYYDNTDIITSYLKGHTKFYNNIEECSIVSVNLPFKEEYEVLTKWVEANYIFECKEQISKFKIQIDYFTNFQLQTNKITIYNVNNWIENISPSAFKVLTSKINSFSFDINNKTVEKLKDTDWDWLTDDEELVYKTNPNLIDTDHDKYTDYEEVVNGWDPVKTSKSPWQNYREEMPQWVIENIQANLKWKNNNPPSNGSASQWLMAVGYGMEYLNKSLKAINDYVKTSNVNFFYIFGIVIILWFIHAFGPWHSKSLLVSYIVDKNKWFFDWLWFITIFTITHLIDIVVLFVVSKLIFKIYDITNYMLYIQRFSLVVLIGFSFYLAYKAIKEINNKKLINNEHWSIEKNSSKWTWLVGFVAWLAPCTFGWSIFLLLFSLWSLSLILPLILALWIWIYLCLLSILIITLLIKNQVYSRIKLLATYSSLASSVILVWLSFYLLYMIF